MVYLSNLHTLICTREILLGWYGNYILYGRRILKLTMLVPNLFRAIGSAGSVLENFDSRRGHGILPELLSKMVMHIMYSYFSS